MAALYVDPLPLTRYRDRLGRYQRPHTFNFSKPVHARIRVAVYAADNFTCLDCGYRPDEIPDNYDGHRNIGRLSLDHIISLRMGGARFDRANLRTLCLPCNARKGLD